MTFLNPIALFGLAAAAIPIMLHIFNLRKLQTIEFSTLSFLKELQKTKIRRLKLRQLLLLILRILLIVLTVIAFSRPTLKGSLPGSLSDQAKTTAVVIFDDSQSMTAIDEKGELLQQAENSASQIINLLKDGDEVFLVKLSEVALNGNPDAQPAQRNFNVIRKELKEIKPSCLHRTIEDALRYAARLLSASRNFNKEIYVISDFQSGSLESKQKVSKAAENLFSPSTQLFLIQLGKREIQNVSIESVEIPNAIFEVNKPFIVKAKLVNHSASDVKNHVVSIYQNEIRTSQKGVDIRAGQSAETEFTLVPRQAGFIEGKIVLEDDDLDFDNRRFFIVHIPEEINVLLAGKPDDLKYLRLALNTRLSDSTSGMKITEITTDRLSLSNLNRTDVLILNNPSEITQNQAVILKSYIQSGGGLLIFPDKNLSTKIFNTNIANVLDISTIVSIDTLSGGQASGGSGVEFEKVDFQHPLFRGMFEKDEIQHTAEKSQSRKFLESPVILISLRFLPGLHSKIIITLSNGNPFLVEEKTGTGKVLMVSTAANITWSDLPLKGLFVPLVHRSVTYLAQQPESDQSIIAGEEKTVQFRILAASDIKIIKPGGLDILVNVQQRNANKYAQFYDTDIDGFYTAKTGDSVISKFSVNIDPDESETIPSTNERQEKLFKQLGFSGNSVHKVLQPEETKRIITESRLGAELWKQFLIAALIVAIIEMLVARDGKKSILKEPVLNDE